MVLELNFKVICVFAGAGMKHRRIFKENKLMVLLVENTHTHTLEQRDTFQLNPHR